MALSSTIKHTIQATLSKALDLSTPQDALTTSISKKLGTGSGDDAAADSLWHDERTLASGADETLDLTASLTNAFGEAVTFAKIHFLYIRNQSTADSLLVGGAAADPLLLFNDVSDILKIPPGGYFTLLVPVTAGLTVGSNDKLKLTHSGDSTDNLAYDIIILGNST